MIISRRRFEAEISRAVAKREDELCQRRRYEEETRDVWRTIHALEDQVRKLEEKADKTADANVDIVPEWKV